MFNFSNLKNRPVLSKDLLCIIGNLNDCVFEKDLDKIAYFLCINNEGDFLVSLDNLSCINDALVVKEMAKIKHLEDVDFTTLKTILNKDIYSDNGHHMGVVKDLTFSQNGKVGQIIVDNGTLKASDVAGVGEIILLKATTKKRKKTKDVSLSSLAVEDRPVVILDDSNMKNIDDSNEKDKEASPAFYNVQAIEKGANETALAYANDDTKAIDNTENNHTSSASKPSPQKGVEYVVEQSAVPIVATAPNVTVSSTTTQPPRIISDYNFLLGRVLTADLYTFSGDLIAYKGASITIAIVDKARLNGKLLELTSNSRFDR